MQQPERLYYPLSKAAEILDCDVDYLIHLATIDFAELCIKYNGQNDDSTTFYWSAYLFEDEVEKQFEKEQPTDSGYTLIDVDYSTKLTKVKLQINCKRLEDGKLEIFTTDFSSLNGVVKIPSEKIRDSEDKFIRGESCNLRVVSIPKTSLKVNSKFLDFSEDYTLNSFLEFTWLNDFSIRIEDLIMTHEELRRLKNGGFPSYEKMTGSPLSGNNQKDPFDNPKTLSKLPELTRGLLSLIPNLNKVDVDATSAEKILELISIEAARQGTAIPDYHIQTIAKYFGKKPAIRKA
ncbi:hypothetical protein [Serratia sp. PL7]|uniref:hypothetical protein n=1 Tax=Serratia sp. PL7 TaxID=2952201 RepID=UPI0021ADFE1F|nr:hypothetical protein [Serratia sp. PL7]